MTDHVRDFLAVAFRNIDLPPLSAADMGDIADALDRRELRDERKAVLQNKRVNDAIQTALERGELYVTSNGYLSAIVEQQP